MEKYKKNGFTLVELLAVIVILAIVLVIAVPKVLDVINDSKKATLESTAKMIASAAEKAKMQNTLLSNTKEITCESVAKLNNVDYSSCSVDFEGNTAKVTIEGSGKFVGLNVCAGTKTSAIAQKEFCEPKIKSLEVRHPIFLSGHTLTPDKFEVIAKYSNGDTARLWSGGLKVDETVQELISSPNWPENYPVGMTESENYWEASYEGAESIQIIFDEASELASLNRQADSIKIYDKNGTLKQTLSGNSFAGSTITVGGDYIKITMKSVVGDKKGFSATIKPIYNIPAEYTLSPSTVPNTNENFDITLSVNGQNLSKKINTKISNNVAIKDYVASYSGFEAVHEIVEHNGIKYDTGTRYSGAGQDVNNKVYYNCEDTDSSGNSYGAGNYDYQANCETWSIIGAFDVEDGKGNTEKRVKLINLNSTFEASWDSSASDINGGSGINQWGPSTYADGTTYEGSDLMQLLNGYYIGKTGSECKYNKGEGQAGFALTCTTDELITAKMKPLTLSAKNMIDDAVWDTYGMNIVIGSDSIYDKAGKVYLEEKGISSQKTGKICTQGDQYCNDTIERTTSWIGLVGLISASDMLYTNGWITSSSSVITPMPNSSSAYRMWYGSSVLSGDGSTWMWNKVSPSVYLKSNVKIIGGNGNDKPYILSLD